MINIIKWKSNIGENGRIERRSDSLVDDFGEKNILCVVLYEDVIFFFNWIEILKLLNFLFRFLLELFRKFNKINFSFLSVNGQKHQALITIILIQSFLILFIYYHKIWYFIFSIKLNLIDLF